MGYYLTVAGAEVRLVLFERLVGFVTLVVEPVDFVEQVELVGIAAVEVVAGIAAVVAVVQEVADTVVGSEPVVAVGSYLEALAVDTVVAPVDSSLVAVDNYLEPVVLVPVPVDADLVRVDKLDFDSNVLVDPDAAAAAAADYLLEGIVDNVEEVVAGIVNVVEADLGPS